MSTKAAGKGARLWFSPYVVLTEAQTRAIAARGVVSGFLACALLEAVADQCGEAVRFAHGAMMPRRRKRRV